MVTLRTAALLLALAPLQAAAQVAEDASVLPKGRLRLSLDPQRLFYDERLTREGDRERWTTDFEHDAFGSFEIPSLAPHETAIRALTGLSSFQLSFGGSTLDAEADTRWTPLRIELGVSNRLTVGLGVPIVKTRVRAQFRLDTAVATVGWNPTLPEAGDPAGLAAYETLFAQLSAAIAALDANIQGGQYGCPTAPECAAAQDLLVRAQAFETQLMGLVLGAVGSSPSPVLPLARNEAATALAAQVAGLQAEFVALGVTGFTQAPAFPTDPLDNAAFHGFLASERFGIASRGLVEIERWGVGDAELSAKYLLLDRASLRVAAAGVIRLPTATLDDADHFFDLPSGDRQLDLEARAHLDVRLLEELAASLSVRYVHQRPATLVRRVTPHTRPIGDLTTRREVERKFGDILEVTLVPSVFLAPQLDVFLVGSYRRKGGDRVTESGGSTPAEAPFPADVLELDTSQSLWRIGGGLRYRPSRTLETGLTYLSTLNGDGGLTPAVSYAAISFRLYYALFGRPAPEAAPPPP